jgi:hypothetical protein
VFFSTKSFSQESYSISGKVISSVNNTTLQGSVIKIINSRKRTLVDSNGYFSLTDLEKGIYNLEVMYIGYEENVLEVEIKDSSISGLLIVLNTVCPVDRQIADFDISYGIPKLYLIGSISPVIFKTDPDFEKKYDIKYYDYGCTPPAYECVFEYNMRIFEFLDNKFNSAWRNEVRKDVIGFCYYNKK